jgi:hypothetical protein
MFARESGMAQKPTQPSREGVTSDPDRGVAVNTGTDPTRPGTPPRPVKDTDPPGTSAEETGVTGGASPAGNTSGRSDVERPSGPPSDVERH